MSFQFLSLLYFNQSENVETATTRVAEAKHLETSKCFKWFVICQPVLSKNFFQESLAEQLHVFFRFTRT
jgi:hypothetical protein